MVTIIKGSRHLTVPKGAFDSIYAPNGWQLAKDAKKESREPKTASKSSEETNTSPEDKNENLTPLDEELDNADAADDNDEDEEVEYVDPEELEEKPLEELDFEELKILADYLGVQTRGLKSKKEVRAAIEKFRSKK